MTQNEAITKATELWKKWVSLRPAVGHNGYLRHSDSMEDYRFYDLDKIHESIIQEYRWVSTGKSKASPALVSEIRGELIALGKIKAALEPEFDRINHGPLEHPVSEPVNALDGVDSWSIAVDDFRKPE